ncbi:GNAT family N-acetyltransferase [Silvimonas amylolytica]|uniref:Ribosomal-protein-alanine acetyltransferase n=1 Tax=Silvimonas amylolytica TaxID=449663 RepID=A0ABQ2PHM9_9NEIS|nr:GNAT family N-acetyltransferase [Silvimonas amylolytica]GGP25123.1 ribosomal-protein-alanine acetyltransferase [Silvimonas amylolytica]
MNHARTIPAARMSPIQITTARLLLDIPPPEDAPLLATFDDVNRRHLARWEPIRDLNWYAPESYGQRQQQAIEQFAAGSALHLVLHDKATGSVVGKCSYTNIVRGPFLACNLGYSLGAAWQGRGLMLEALKAANHYVFNELGLHRIMAAYMPLNERSGRLLKRLGFEREGLARSYLCIAGQWEDHVLTSLINPATVRV